MCVPAHERDQKCFWRGLNIPERVEHHWAGWPTHYQQWGVLASGLLQWKHIWSQIKENWWTFYYGGWCYSLRSVAQLEQFFQLYSTRQKKQNLAKQCFVHAQMNSSVAMSNCCTKTDTSGPVAPVQNNPLSSPKAMQLRVIRINQLCWALSHSWQLDRPLSRQVVALL